MRTVLCALLLVLVSSVAAQPVPVQLESKVMSETRTILVRTPASYAGGTRAYPVLYLTDGDRQIGHTAAVVDFLAREGRMPEVIVVGISNTDRTRDLTPTKVERFGGNFATPTSGGGDRFLDFIATEVIPYVEKNYRTQPYRVFAGHSFGGLFAMHAFLTRPGLFNGVIAVSPTLTWDNRYVYRRAQEWVKKTPERPVTLVVSVGNEGEELDRELDALKSLLQKSGPKSLELEFVRYPDEDHGSVVLPTHYAGLRKVFEPFRFVLGPPTDDPKKLYARAREHFAKASARVGFAVPIPEQTTNAIGYRLLQAGHVQEAIEVFRANAEAWPASANVYDSLGEAQERAGAFEQALASYRRAAAIGKTTNDPNLAVYEQNAERVAKR
ncbi:MAG TPA: alpha/beta hydrolase-fold protein [Thermoanaerobaculia bacterium]|nr:alpha/beta hydrolase-fold protein [Thermoanaerobaculia bacterium]